MAILFASTAPKKAQSDRPLWPTSVCSVAKLENKERGKQKNEVTQGIGSKLERREGARPCAISFSGPGHSSSGPKRE